MVHKIRGLDNCLKNCPITLFLSPEIAPYIYIPCLLCFTWSTVVMSGLVTLVATWNCLDSKNKNAVLLYPPLLLLLNSWLIEEMGPA